MGDTAPTPSRALAMGKTIAKFVAAWSLFAFFVTSQAVSNADFWLRNAIYRVFAGFPAIAVNVERVYGSTLESFAVGYAIVLFFGSFLAPMGAAARMVARARVRAGRPDFLDRPRAWAAAHPKAMRVLAAVPAALWIERFVWQPHYASMHPVEYAFDLAHAAIPMAFAAWGVTRMTGKGIRELLAPTSAVDPSEASFQIGPDEIVFDAVAVTWRTLAMVALFAAVTVAVPLYIATRPILELFRERSIFYVAASYIFFAVTGAFAFRKASHVAVGLDGVHVRGTSRPRFFAYLDIDSARASGSDIELVRRGRVVLRLQLHGEDAARREAVLARITENIARVKEGRGAVAARLVATSSKDDLARVAHGAADYRMATLTREQLWALVEGPEVEASARKAAAEALVASGDGRERARLRVAADHCAEPNVRVTLAELAGTDGEEVAPRSARAARVV